VELKGGLDPLEPSLAYEALGWVVVHGRGVLHTGHANFFVKVLATAGNLSGKESYYYMRYDDSPERDNIPHLFYAVFGNPTIDTVLHEEVEPVGHVFSAMVVMDSSMLMYPTSQRALLFDGAKEDAVLVVNTSLNPNDILHLVKKYALTGDWEGKLVTVKANDYGPDISYPLLGALAKALPIVGVDDIEAALASLGLEAKAAMVKRAHDESTVTAVRIRAVETEAGRRRSGRTDLPTAKRGLWWNRTVYERYKTAAADATSYGERIKAMPPWEALSPGLIEFGPLPGERNTGFRTSFSRYIRPVLDAKICTDCKLCSVYCPDGAIDFTRLTIDYNYCQGCAICEQVCPPKAIQMVSELKIKEGMNEEMVTSIAEALREYGY